MHGFKVLVWSYVLEVKILKKRTNKGKEALLPAFNIHLN